MVRDPVFSSSGHSTRKVAFAGCREFSGIFADDAFALPFLTARGIEVVGWSWDDPDAPWAEHDAVVIRSTWDYSERIEEFERWIKCLRETGVRVLNPPDLLLWNARKTYLRDLEARGVAIVPTLFVDPDEVSTLPDKIRSLDATQVIVKPAVSAGARGLIRLRSDEVEARQSELTALAVYGTLLVQPYLAEVETEGEWSLLYLGGKPSHAVLKMPKPGDFRVHEHFGGSVYPLTPPSEFLRAAEEVVTAAPGPTLYARVDLIRAGSRVLLGELEVLEPLLYLEHDPLAPARFAAAIDEAVPGLGVSDGFS